MYDAHLEGMFDDLIEDGLVLEPQKEDIMKKLEEAFEYGIDAGYYDGVCDGYSQAKDEEYYA